MGKEKSPLEKIVEAQQSLPLKVIPKSRKVSTIQPIVEDSNPVKLSQIPKINMSNSSFVFNLSVSLDSDAIDTVFDRTTRAAKKLAAAGAAMLGTALIFNSPVKKYPTKPKIPVKPKTKVPNFKK